MSINFYLEKRPNKAGENPIRAQVSIRSSVLISTIGYSVNPDVWNGEQVDLNSFELEILDKYKDEKFPEGLALPVISNQKMNHYLKDLGELCGFSNPITRVCYRGGERVEETFPKYALIGTHAGRRTFICFALSSGIPPQVVMKWTGHSDYKVMKPYIDIAEKSKANAMNLFEMELKK